MSDADDSSSSTGDGPSSGVSATDDSSSTTDAGPCVRAVRALHATHSGDNAAEEAHMVPDAAGDTAGTAARDDASDTTDEPGAAIIPVSAGSLH